MERVHAFSSVGGLNLVWIGQGQPDFWIHSFLEDIACRFGADGCELALLQIKALVP